MRDAAAAMGFAKVKRISMVEIEGAYEAGSGGHGRFYLRAAIDTVLVSLAKTFVGYSWIPEVSPLIERGHQ